MLQGEKRGASHWATPGQVTNSTTESSIVLRQTLIAGKWRCSYAALGAGRAGDSGGLSGFGRHRRGATGGGKDDGGVGVLGLVLERRWSANGAVVTPVTFGSCLHCSFACTRKSGKKVNGKSWLYSSHERDAHFSFIVLNKLEPL